MQTQMPRPSPQTDRIVALINLLVAHPGEGFTLSEIARRLHVNKATCHPMIGALTLAGFLIRHPTRRTYHLGPALIAAGQTAAAGFPALEVARPVLLEVSEHLGLTCLAVASVGDHLLLVDQVWDPRREIPLLRVGQELPFRAPWGSIFAAWSPPDAATGWAARAGASVDRYAEALDAVRQRGYSVELQGAPADRLREIVAALADTVAGTDRDALAERLLREVGSEQDTLLSRPERDRCYAVGSVAAPVFDGRRQVVLGLSVVGFTEPVTGAGLAAIGERLLAAAAAITRALGGGAEPGPGPGA
jgi:DNA-binding IclR family transcriptional regulator